MYRIIFFMLLLILLLHACTVDQTDRADVDQPTVILSFAAAEDDHPTYQPLLEEFMRTHPQIEVMLVSLEEMLNMAESGAPGMPGDPLRRVVARADIAPSFIVSPEAYGSDLLLNLKPLMDADADFQADDFYPGTLERAMVNDVLWMLPQSFQVPLLAYNKEAFKHAQLPEPDFGLTVDELLGLAEQLTQEERHRGATYGLLDPSGGTYILLAILQSQNIDLAHQPIEEVRLDQPHVIAAVQRIQALMEQRALLLPGYAGGEDEQNPLQLLREDRLGLWPDDAFAVSGDSTFQEPIEIGKLPLPEEMHQLLGDRGYGYIVSAGTAYPREAWQLITFLSKQPIGDLTSAAYGQIPARQSTAELGAFWETLDPDTAAAYQWTITHATGTVPRPPDPMLIDALQHVLQVTLTEQGDPVRIVSEAQQHLQQTVANSHLTPVPSPAADPIIVATPQLKVSEDNIHVTFAVEGYSIPTMRDLARIFQERHPNISIQIESTDTLTMPPTLETLAQTSDCFLWHRPSSSETDFVALLDLQPLIDADPEFAPDVYPPAVFASYQYDGRLIGLPYAIVPFWLVYNQTVFEIAGVEEPTAQWTLDDFLAAAQSLTIKSGSQKQYGYVPLGHPARDLIFFIGQFGGQLTTGGGADVQPNFNDPRVVAAIQWYIDLARVYEVMPPLQFPHTPGDTVDRTSEDSIRSGHAAMWFDTTFESFEAQNFTQGIAPLPVGSGALRSSDFSVSGMFLSAQTEHIQPCWEWMKFLSNDVTNLRNALPARTTLVQTEAFIQQVPTDMLEQYQTYADIIQQAVPVNDIPRLQQMDLYWFYEALTRTIEQDADLATELDWAQRMTATFMSCLAEEHDAAVCAVRVDPDYRGYNIP